MHKKIIISLMVVLTASIIYVGFLAHAQITSSSDCSSAQVTEFGNIVVNGSQQFFSALYSQANADLTAKEQTDAAIQAGEADDEVKIATATAGMNAIATCIANQQSNQQTNQTNGT